MKRAFAGIFKFLGRAILVAAGVIALGWGLEVICELLKVFSDLLAFIFERMGTVSTWLMHHLHEAWNWFLPNWATYLIFAVLAAIVWTVAEIYFARRKKKQEPNQNKTT